MEIRRRQTDDMVSVGRDLPATRQDLASVESSFTRDIANLRNVLWLHTAELQAQAIRQEIRGQFERVGRGIVGDMRDFRRDMRRELRTLRWMAAALLAEMALMATGVIALALR